jgi:hypothetical protein
MAMKMAAAAAMMVLAWTQAALAQDPTAPVPIAGGQGARAGMGGACKADFEKFCQGIPAGGGSRMQCLNDHRLDLSDDCKAKMTTNKIARQACALDAAKYCPSDQGADRLKCMAANKDKLSEGCKSALSPAAVETQ